MSRPRRLRKPVLNCKISPCRAVAPATVTTFSIWMWCLESAPCREERAAFTSFRFVMTRSPWWAVGPMWRSPIPARIVWNTFLASSAVTRSDDVRWRGTMSGWRRMKRGPVGCVVVSGTLQFAIGSHAQRIGRGRWWQWPVHIWIALLWRW